MSKHVILASEMRSSQFRYFLGYKDDGEFCEVLWSFDPWQATWINTLEIDTETALLARLCPTFFLQSLRLDEVKAFKAR